MTKSMVFWICGGERFSGVLATQHPPFRYHCIIDHQPNTCFFSFHFFFPPRTARGKNAQSRAWLARHHKRTKNNSLHYFSS